MLARVPATTVQPQCVIRPPVRCAGAAKGPQLVRNHIDYRVLIRVLVDLFGDDFGNAAVQRDFSAAPINFGVEKAIDPGDKATHRAIPGSRNATGM